MAGCHLSCVGSWENFQLSDKSWTQSSTASVIEEEFKNALNIYSDLWLNSWEWDRYETKSWFLWIFVRCNYTPDQSGFPSIFPFSELMEPAKKVSSGCIGAKLAKHHGIFLSLSPRFKMVGFWFYFDTNPTPSLLSCLFFHLSPTFCEDLWSSYFLIECRYTISVQCGQNIALEFTYNFISR